jgi:hypothetical protein
MIVYVGFFFTIISNQRNHVFYYSWISKGERYLREFNANLVPKTWIILNMFWCKQDNMGHTYVLLGLILGEFFL